MKKLFFSMLVICISGAGHAQTFMQGVGINIMLQSTSGYSTNPVGAIMYSPRVSFMETETTSLSVGIPLSFGVSGSYSSQNYGSNSLGLMFDAPLMFDYNYGAGSTKEAEDKFGFFGGVGFGYHSNEYVVSDMYGSNYTAKMSGWGPVGNAGVRIGVGHGSHNIEARFSYMKTMDDSKSNVIGIGGLFNF